MNPKIILGIPILALFVALVTLIRPDAEATMDLYQRDRRAASERVLRRPVQQERPGGNVTLEKHMEEWSRRERGTLLPFPKCPTHNLDTNGHYALTLVDSKGVEYVTCYKDYQDAQFLLLRLAGLHLVRKEGK